MRPPSEDMWGCHFVLKVKQEQNRTAGQGSTEGPGTKGPQSARTMMSEGKAINGLRQEKDKTGLIFLKVHSACSWKNAL